MSRSGGGKGACDAQRPRIDIHRAAVIEGDTAGDAVGANGSVVEDALVAQRIGTAAADRRAVTGRQVKGRPCCVGQYTVGHSEAVVAAHRQRALVHPALSV